MPIILYYYTVNALGSLDVRISASTSVPFRPTTMQMPNLLLVETNRITVYIHYEFISIGLNRCYEFDVPGPLMLAILNSKTCSWFTFFANLGHLDLASLIIYNTYYPSLVRVQGVVR